MNRITHKLSSAIAKSSHKGLLFLAFVLMCSIHTNAQYWVQKAGGITIDEAADIALDNAGNSYTVGYFTGTATFGSTTLTAEGSTDIFLVKTNNQGVIQWAVSAGGTASDKGLSIAVDNAGTSYITGFYNGTATFDTTSLTSLGLQDVFIAKYDANGNLDWVKSMGGTNSDIGNGIAIDWSGNVAVTGEFAGLASFGSTNLTSLAGTTDAFILKLSSAGTVSWVKKGSGNSLDRGVDIACDQAGNIYAIGQFSNNITFDVLHTNSNLNENFLIKYSASGSEQWFRQIGGGSSNVATALAADSVGNLYVTGDFTGTVFFYGSPNVNLSGNYSNRVFVAKYNNSGQPQWATAASSESDLTSRAIAADNEGNSYITGHFKCQLGDFRDSYGSGIFQVVGKNDIFVSKYDSTGTWQYARHFAGKNEDYGYGIDVKVNDQAHFCGSFKDTINIPTSSNFIASNLSQFTANNCTGNNGFCNDPNYGNFTAVSGFLNNSDILIANVIDPNREPYDFFDRTGVLNCTRDFFELCQMPGCPDTFTNCNGFNSTIQFFQCSDLGPRYTTNWFGPVNEDPQYQHNGLVSNSGNVISSTSAADACILTIDTLVSVVLPGPAKGRITDNQGLNNNSQNPIGITVCQPATLTLMAGNLGVNSFYWSSLSLPANLSDTSITVDTTGVYSLIVTDSNGCQKVTNIDIIIAAPLPPFELRADLDDTLVFCDNQQAGFWMYDSISNPTAQEICMTLLPYPVWTTVTSVTPSTLPANDICGSTILLYPDTSMQVTVEVMVVRVSPCGNDTHYLTESFFLVWNPSPEIPPFGLEIIGDSVFCPGDSLLLTAINGPNYTWQGSASVAGYTGDSVIVADSGTYSVLSTLSDTNSFGCITNVAEQVALEVKEKKSPQIFSNTTLICPNTTVSIYAVQGATSNYSDSVYFWEGPSGPIAGNGPTISVTQPGQYFCMVMDEDSCGLVSNTINLTQYTVPKLSTVGDNIICENDSVTINVITNEGSFIFWFPPLSGNALSQTVFSPGFYTCGIFSCGIYTVDTVEIVASDVKAEIEMDGPLCDNQSVMLLGNDSMQTYSWFPNSENTQNLEVTEEGAYVLTTIDSAGCFAVSDTLWVENHQVPTIIGYDGDSVLCFGETLELVGNEAMSNYLWAPTNDTTRSIFITEAGTYQLSTVDTNGCEGDAIPILISMPDTFINSEAEGELRFCEGDSVLLKARKNGYDTYVWNPGNFEGKNYMVYETGIYQLVATDTFGCEAFSTKYTIYAKPNLIGKPIGYDTIICSGTQAYLIASTNIGEIEWLDSITEERVAVGTDFLTDPIFENTTFLVWSNHELCNSDSAYITVYVQDCETPTLPNVFTPNGDGVNDLFRLSLNESECFHGYIYNRWGALIFESDHINIGWDGTVQGTGEAVPEGTYFYLFDYCKHDGQKARSEGTVTLLRK